MLAALEALDAAGSLAKQRPMFVRQLRDAQQTDHAASSRRAQARQQTKTASRLSKWARAVEDTWWECRHTIDVAVNGGSIYFGPPEGIAAVPQLAAVDAMDHTAAWLVAELRKRERISKQIAKWYRSQATEKRAQWGPATVETVDGIIRFVQTRFSILSKKHKPIQKAECYAGLLCMHVGLLTVKAGATPKRIADTVRGRLNRSQRLIQAVQRLDTHSSVTSVIQFPRSR